jgi:hypothetical protein
MERQSIRLIGGPLDGEQRWMHPASNHYFEEWDAGPADLWPPPARKRDHATYRRVDTQTFRFVRTQSALGDRDGLFWAETANERWER